MEAEDTVMKPEEIKEITIAAPTATNFAGVFTNCYKAVAEAQAEISFKMGYNQALKDVKDGLSPSPMV